jgi:hypothetical protein
MKKIITLILILISVTGYSQVHRYVKVQYDSSKIVTPYALSTALAPKLNISDTAAMLIPYANRLQSVQAGTNITINNANPLNPIINSINTDSLTQIVTYAQLLTAISVKTLINGRSYILSDFRTVYKVYGGLDTASGSVEPLILTATSDSTISINAFSPKYPNDIIHYSVTDNSPLAPTSGSKGVILFRKDALNNLSTYYDWRVVKWRRWALAAGGIYWAFSKNFPAIATDSTMYLTFGTNNTNISIGGNSWNIVIGDDNNAVKIGSDVGTFGSGVNITSNNSAITIDDECATVQTTGSGYIGGIHISSANRYINIGKRSYNISIGSNCYAIDLGLQNSDIAVPSNTIRKRIEKGFSNFEATVELSNKTANLYNTIVYSSSPYLYSTANYCGIINLTSVKSTDTLDFLFAQLTSLAFSDISIRPASGLSLLVRDKSVATTVGSNIDFGGSNLLVNGTTKKYFKIHKNITNTYGSQPDDFYLSYTNVSTSGGGGLDTTKIPLSGTVVGKPITGDLVLDNTTDVKRIKGAVQGSYIEFSDDGQLSINVETGSNVNVTGIDFNGQNSGGSVGITGVRNYSANYQPLTYVQKVYADSIANLRLRISDTASMLSPYSRVSVSSYGKNATRDSTILLLSDGTRFAARDSIGSGGGSGIPLTGTIDAAPLTGRIRTTNDYGIWKQWGANDSYANKILTTGVIDGFNNVPSNGAAPADYMSAVHVGEVKGVAGEEVAYSRLKSTATDFDGTDTTAMIYTEAKTRGGITSKVVVNAGQGLEGAANYSASYGANSFVQKAYVDARPIVTSFGKNATRDSTILLLSNGTRFAAKDSIHGGGHGGGGGGTTTLTGDVTGSGTSTINTTYDTTSLRLKGVIRSIISDSIKKVVTIAPLQYSAGVGSAPDTLRADTTTSAGFATQTDINLKANLSGAALTEASVNGVTLTTAAGTETFLRGDGTYAAIPEDEEVWIISISDQTTALTTGTGKFTFRVPYGASVNSVRASLKTASSSGIPTFDINKNGTTILSTKLTIDANEKTSSTAAVSPVISVAGLDDDSEITIDIDVAGTGAIGAVIYIYHTKTGA